MSLFELRGFTVDVNGDRGTTRLAEQIELSLDAGQTLCVVGESGSGKSVTLLSAVRLLELTAPVELAGEAMLGGTDLLAQSQRQMATIRGRRIGMIFQEAMDALNPTRTVKNQLVEAFGLSAASRNGSKVSRRDPEAVERATRLLAEVGLGDHVLDMYPHQLSGGMQQRVMIAMALMGEPELLIADEPTTALDVTVQADILRLLKNLRSIHQMACIFVTHDMGVAAEISDRIAVMYAGHVVEVGPTADVIHEPQHAYTKALLECVPRPNTRVTGLMRTIAGSVPAPGTVLTGDRFAPRNPLATARDRTQPPPLRVSADGRRAVRAWEPVLEWTDEKVARLTGSADRAEPGWHRATPTDEPIVLLEKVSKTYGSGLFEKQRRARRSSQAVDDRAVKDLDLVINRGEFFGVVGETGSGKSTLGKLVLGLENADPGSSIHVSGCDVTARRSLRAERAFRRRVQMVFQNPQDTLDPRRTVGEAISEPIEALTDLDRRATRLRVAEMIDAVGLPEATIEKYASELSGGQRQRVAIARAIAPQPEVIVADEPTSALDVSVQGQVMNLLLTLQQQFALTYVFITHNLSLVTAVADRIGVMRSGELVEVLSADALIAGAEHPYTRALAAANPDPFKRTAPRVPSAGT